MKSKLKIAHSGIEVETEMIPFEVETVLPPALQNFLQQAKQNIAWTWNPRLMDLLDEHFPNSWEAADKNIILFFKKLSLEDLNRIQTLPQLRQEFEKSTKDLELLNKEVPSNPEIAYFCMEYGLASSLRFYSGGLGILAGDHLKTASDLKMSLSAVGLAYQHGYFRQSITATGDQVSHRATNNFENLPMALAKNAAGENIKFKVRFPGRDVTVQAWKTHVGRVPLYLLDTQVPENNAADQKLTDHLYGGDSQHRLQQEILLGVGGYWLLKSLNRTPRVFHLNEGHAAFLVWARMIDLIHDKKLSFEEALEYVHQTSVFTTHTPVPAGHDKFSDDMIRPYLEIYSQEMKVDLAKISTLGKLLKENQASVFSMTDLALRGSSFVNGVSQIHGRVAREMFQEIYPGLHDSEVPVKGITNGVHVGTWLSHEWQDLFKSKLGDNWFVKNHENEIRDLLNSMGPAQVWNQHLTAKRRLVAYLREHIRKSFPKRNESPALTAAAIANVNERALIFGFARRFAPYKRATLLFQHLDKIAALIQSGYPMVFVYAGKAHPNDKEGQALIKKVIELSRDPKFVGRVLFLENYEMDMARHLVQGVDVWLNTPTRPLEASGTSGMKASINGVLNLSVDDGWWSEAYNGKNGWLIADKTLNEGIDFQLEYDSAQIYSILESDVVPTFFDRDDHGLPLQWIEKMKESIVSTIWEFSTSRMLGDYQSKFFDRAKANAAGLEQNAYEPVKSLTSHKSKMLKTWETLKIEGFETTGLKQGEKIPAGGQFEVRARIVHPGMDCGDLLVQAVVAQVDADGNTKDFIAADLSLSEDSQGRSLWRGPISVKKSGPFQVGVRVLPKLETERGGHRVFMHLSKWS